MTAIIPFRSSTLPPGELAAVLAEVPAALPAAGARLVEGRGEMMMDPATLALFIGAGATTVAGLVGAIATVWAARITARQPAERSGPQVIVILIETNHTTDRLVVDAADPAAALTAAAALPTALEAVTGMRLERGSE